ncbi:hypothetical protein M430DRAFT_101088, partial [Amorphotheca resinae ATCC 22711]
INVKGYAILNVYRQLQTLEVIDYITYLLPLVKCLIKGDFNACYDMFKPRA